MGAPSTFYRSRCQTKADPHDRFRRTAERASVSTSRRTAAYAQASVAAPIKHVVENVTADKVGVAWDRDEAAPFFQAYSSQPIERSMRIPASAIKGTIPADLHGTLLRNGPGNFEFGEQRISHPFDGDGLVSAFTFEDGNVLMRRKFVRTKAMKDELAARVPCAERLLYKGAFTVGDPSGSILGPLDFSVRQPANTGVLDWAGRVMALYERDHPYVLKDTLDTAGRSNVGVWEAGDSMAAHWRVMVEPDGSKRLITFNALEAGLDGAVKILELDERGAKLHETTVKLPGAAFGFFHDMLATPNYYVLVENPLSIDLRKLLTQYMFGNACIAECLFLDPAKVMKIHCIPRPGKQGRKRVVYESANKFAFHHINAWEEDGDTIVVDTIATDEIDFGVSIEACPLFLTRNPAAAMTPRRLVLRGDNRRAHEFKIRSDNYTELPTPMQPATSGQQHTHFFAMTGRAVPAGLWGFNQCVCKIKLPPSLGVSEPFDSAAVDITQYYPGDSRYCGETIFVPKGTDASAATEEGYLLVLVNDLRAGRQPTTWLEVLDAADIAAGPVAAIDIGDLLAPGLHGSWTDRVLGAVEGEELPWVNDIRVSFP